MDFYGWNNFAAVWSRPPRFMLCWSLVAFWRQNSNQKSLFSYSGKAQKDTVSLFDAYVDVTFLASSFDVLEKRPSLVFRSIF
jgi:hypothetical protein